MDTWFLVVKGVGTQLGVLYHQGYKSVSFGLLGKNLGSQNDTSVKTTRPLIKKVWTVLGQSIRGLDPPSSVSETSDGRS